MPDRPSPAQRAARKAFTEHRRAIRAADRRLHTLPPRGAEIIAGSCHRCGRLAAYDDLELVPERDARGEVVVIWRVHRGACL